MTIRRFARLAAWTGLLLILLVTVSPISARPSDLTTTDLDRALAFLVMSCLFIIAYPKRAVGMTAALLLAAFLIELTQLVSVTRHPQLHDALVKAVGVIAGVCCGLIANLVLRRRQASAYRHDGLGGD